MGDLRSPRLIYAKGVLFLLGCLLASGLLLWEHPTPRLAFLLAVAIWCAARSYYFAFYVVEHYVDPGYHFDGLWSFARYLMRRRGEPPRRPPGPLC